MSHKGESRELLRSFFFGSPIPYFFLWPTGARALFRPTTNRDDRAKSRFAELELSRAERQYRGFPPSELATNDGQPGFAIVELARSESGP